MMPRHSGDILAILSSNDIDYVYLDDYLLTNISQVIYNKDSILSHSIFFWAKKHKIEASSWKINYNLNNPIEELNISILNFCDKVCFFWNETEDDIYKAIKYAEKLDIKYIVHIIKEI